MRLGARPPTRRAPVLVPYLPRGAPHAASTRSPSARAVPSTPVHPPGLIRSALGRSMISSHLLPPPPPLAGAAWSRQPNVCLSTRCPPRPGPIPGPLTLPSPPAGPHGGGPLEAASAAVPAPFAAALAILTRFCSRARAGLILHEAGTRGGPAAPPPPRRRPPRRSAPTGPASHPLPTPLRYPQLTLAVRSVVLRSVA